MSSDKLDSVGMALSSLAKLRDAELKRLCKLCEAGFCSAHQPSDGFIAAVGRDVQRVEELLRLLDVFSLEDEYEVLDSLGHYLHPKRLDLAESAARKGFPVRIRLKVIFANGSILTGPWRHAEGLDLETDPVV